MASQGRGRRGGGRSNNPRPPDFDQQAFIEAIGVATATIAQVSVVATILAQASAVVATLAHASANGSHGGSSNL